MNLLHRYVFKQIVAATAMAVVLFVFVLVLGNVLREVLDRLANGQIDLPMFGYLLVNYIPGVIPYALPLGLLTAVLLVVGRMCAQREYTAMRAAGLSLWSLAAPIMLVACLGAALCLFINLYYAPAADRAVKVALTNLVRQDPSRLFIPGSYVRDFRGYVIRAGGRDGPQLLDVWIWKLDDQGRASVCVHGSRGHLDYNPATDYLTLVMDKDSEGAEQSYNPADPNYLPNVKTGGPQFNGGGYPLKLSDLVGASTPFTKFSLLTVDELLVLRDNYPRNLPPPEPKKLAIWRMDVQMQIQRDFAGAFSVLALALLGLPLSLRVGRAENFVNLALALGLALVYYFLLFSINLLHTHPELRPDLVLWLPNFIFEGLGLWMLYRAAKR